MYARRFLCVSLTLVVACVLSASASVSVSAAERQKRNVDPSCNTVHTLMVCNLGGYCANGATCVVLDSCAAGCNCPPGYTGASCDTEDSGNGNNQTCGDNKCDTTIVCANGGTCVWNDTSCHAQCTCSADFTGDVCDTPLNDTNTLCTSGSPCITARCDNGGTCQLTSNCSPVCVCPSEYTGESCDTPVNMSRKTTQEIPTTPTLRPVEERVCDGGFECYYGVCKVTDGDHVCVCDPGYIKFFCHVPCSLNCGENGRCDRKNDTSPEFCSCYHPYIGDTCEEKMVVPGAVSWQWWLVGIIVVLLVLLLLLVALGYVLLRRKNIFMMKVLYFFQPYEDDDGKMFDAFVSYKSAPEDENFVYRILYPELEQQRDFKLCLHHRDFIPGETIANNILWAIENSRRTILVLSPRYLQSDFTRFEYQRAHDEMLKQKHKVIPLLLEDISDSRSRMDLTLGSILESITYIEWPSGSEEADTKTFWTRLELSLPKKRSSSPSESTESSNKNSVAYENSAFDAMTLEDFKNSVNKEVDDNTGTSLEDVDVVYSRPDSSVSDLRDIAPVSVDTGSEQQGQSKTGYSNEQLKKYFDEPIGDESFSKMREQALNYEQCLDA